MRVLVACEFSGTVRDAFLEAGHDAVSCDLLPSETPGPHVQGDVMPLLHRRSWDPVIAHPPCTYLANSGVRWLYTKPGRWEAMRDGARFFRECLTAESPRICVESPIIHKHARDLVGRAPTQVVQPWMFGQGETKAIALWLTGLPPLIPTNVVEGRHARVHRMAPGPERQKERSRFFSGVAKAMAVQWGNL